MADQLNEALRALKDELLNELGTRFNQIDQKINAINDRVNRIDRNMEAIDDRFNRIDRNINAISSFPVPNIPKSFHSATELHSVSQPKRRRLGYMG